LSLLNKDGVFVIERVRRLPGVADRVRTPEFGIVTILNTPEEPIRWG